MASENLVITKVSTDQALNVDIVTEDNNIETLSIEIDSQEVVPMTDDIIIHKGYSPYVNEETGTWFEYDNKNKCFYDTGVIAAGGIDAAVLNQIQTNKEDIATLNAAKLETEIDPTVPDWAKETSKPTYSASEVGAVDADSEMTFAQIDALFNAVFGGI